MVCFIITLQQTVHRELKQPASLISDFSQLFPILQTIYNRVLNIHIDNQSDTMTIEFLNLPLHRFQSTCQSTHLQQRTHTWPVSVSSVVVLAVTNLQFLSKILRNELNDFKITKFL